MRIGGEAARRLRRLRAGRGPAGCRPDGHWATEGTGRDAARTRSGL